MAESKENKNKPVGGLAFFSSLICLSFLAALNISLLGELWNDSAFDKLQYFMLGCLPGLFLALYAFTGKYNILIHEFKHWLVSGLVGNRFKSIKVGADSGKFTYGYYKHTAAYNAFISVAPYCLPLFTLLTLLIASAGWRNDPVAMVIIVGIGYGTDLIMNTRDISPRQTDLTQIRGGYYVGLAYVVAANLCFASFLLAWVMQGLNGIKLILAGLWQIVNYAVIHHIFNLIK